MHENSTTRILRLEGLAVTVAAVLFYYTQESSWWLFALLILLPDLSMAGYLVNPRFGALCYNTVHTYLIALPILGIALWLEHPPAIAVSTIWICHIGIDRFLGFGLKKPTGFNDTHLGRIGGKAQ